MTSRPQGREHRAGVQALVNGQDGHHYQLGMVQADIQQPAQARAALKKALELDPRLPEAGKVQQLLKTLPPD